MKNTLNTAAEGLDNVLNGMNRKTDELLYNMKKSLNLQEEYAGIGDLYVPPEESNFFKNQVSKITKKGENKINNGATGAGKTIEGSSNIVQNVSELSDNEIEALIKYSGDDYVNINNSLRGLDTMTENNKLTTEALTSALDKASLPEDMILYRGTSTDALGTLKGTSPEDLVGKTITEKGFMSTSTNSSVAKGTFSGDMQMIIEAPKGSKGLDISSISEYSDESEILFQSQQEMVITDAKVQDGVLNIVIRLKK